MPTITNVRIMRFRKVQPEKFGGAGAEVEFNATILEGEDYRDVTRGLLFDARAMCYENLGMRLPKEAFDAGGELASFKAGEGETVTVSPTSEDDIPGEEKPAEKKRGRPAGSKNTRPKAGSKAAKAAEEAAAAAATADIPGEEETPKDQISTGEERVDPDAIPGEDEAPAPEADDTEPEGAEELDGVGFNSYINDSIRASKLTGLQAKLMMKEMGVARVRDLNTPEKLAQAKMMIDAFIASNEATKG